MGRQTEQAYRGVVQFVGQHSFLVPSKLYFYSTVVRRRGGGGLRGDRAEDDPGEASGLRFVWDLVVVLMLGFGLSGMYETKNLRQISDLHTGSLRFV